MQHYFGIRNSDRQLLRYCIEFIRRRQQENEELLLIFFFALKTFIQCLKHPYFKVGQDNLQSMDVNMNIEAEPFTANSAKSYETKDTQFGDKKTEQVT